MKCHFSTMKELYSAGAFRQVNASFYISQLIHKILNHRKFISLSKEFIFARERAVPYKRLPTLEELAND